MAIELLLLLAFIVLLGCGLIAKNVNLHYKNKINQVNRELAMENQLHQSAKTDLEVTQHRLEQKLLDHTAHTEMTYYKLSNQNAALTQQTQALQQKTHLDELTGLSNARLFNTKLNDEIHRAARYEKPLSLILCALDVPPTQGKQDPALTQFADLVYRTVGQAFASTFQRSGDFCARLNEHIFAVAFPETEQAFAQPLAEKIRLAIIEQNAAFTNAPYPFTATLSIGGTTAMPTKTTQLQDVMRVAGLALTQAKQQGGNQTQFVDFV